MNLVILVNEKENKNRLYGAFIMGFFLATFLMMAIIKIQFGPLESTLQSAIPYAQTLYDVTHSSLYSDISVLATWANQTVSTASNLPIIGDFVPQDVPAASAGLVQILTGLKSWSEVILPALKSMLFWLQMTIPAMIVSLIMLVVGGLLYTKGKLM